MQRECDVCGARGDRATKLLKCDGCKSVLYCSEACQRAHWPEHSASADGHSGIMRPRRPQLLLGRSRSKTYNDSDERASSRVKSAILAVPVWLIPRIAAKPAARLVYRVALRQRCRLASRRGTRHTSDAVVATLSLFCCAC